MLRVKLKDVEIPHQEYNIRNQNIQKQDFNLQTDLIQINKEVSTTTQKRTKNFEVQKDEDPVQYVNDVNEQDLMHFLNKAEKIINENLVDPQENAIQQINQQRTFQSSSLLILTLENIENKQKEKGLEILDLDWNCLGNTLACSIGQLQHDSLEEEQTLIYIWNMGNKINQQKPNEVIECNTSIMTLAFHPQNSNILAGGGFNGQIFLWDLSKPELLIHQSTIAEVQGHKEVISQLSWIETGKKQYKLLSASTDGKFLIWDDKLRFPQRGFLLIRKKNNEIGVIGTLCFSQSQDDKNTVLIGTEAGNIQKIMIIPQEKPFQQKKWKPESCIIMQNVHQKYRPEIQQQVEAYCQKNCKNLKLEISDIGYQEIFDARPNVRKFFPNPLGASTQNYEPHLAPIYSIDFSPFFRQYFLSDGMVRLFDVTQNKCIFFIDFGNNYIQRVQWSQTRATVFSVAISNGQTYLFDLSISTKVPVEILNFGESNQFCYSSRFSKKNQKLLSVGYQNCQIGIFELQESLCETYTGKQLFSL